MTEKPPARKSPRPTERDPKRLLAKAREALALADDLANAAWEHLDLVEAEVENLGRAVAELRSYHSQVDKGMRNLNRALESVRVLVAAALERLEEGE